MSIYINDLPSGLSDPGKALVLVLATWHIFLQALLVASQNVSRSSIKFLFLKGISGLS
jgi:hypothetical protein